MPPSLESPFLHPGQLAPPWSKGARKGALGTFPMRAESREMREEELSQASQG